jgi:hypothetical protein
LVATRPTVDETVHDSWRDAVGSLTDPADQYASGGSFERVRQHADAVGAIPAWSPLAY